MQPSKVKEYRLKNGAFHLSQRVQPLTTEELVFSAYLPVISPEMKQLISFFERHLILAKVDPTRFMETRHKETQKLCEWIRKNNAWDLLIRFATYVHRNVNRGEKEVLYVYESLIMDTVYHITPFGKIWYGMDKGQPLFMKDFFGAYDVRGWELNELIGQKHITEKQRLKYVQELLDYNIKCEKIRIQERNVMNIVYNMIGLINRDNEAFVFPGEDWFNHTYVDFLLPRMHKDSSFYEGLLNQRSFLLDSEGVVIECFNAGMFKEVRFLEQFLEDGLIFLYRVTNEDNKHTMGFIDLRNFHFYSLWEHATTESLVSGSEMENLRTKYRSFLLELYCHLTCSFAKNSDDREKLITLKHPEDAGHLKSSQIGIYCKVQDETEHLTDKSRRQVTQKVLHKVRPFVRKGNASEMAKANARLFGLILEPNYTFVREHVRGKAKEEMLTKAKKK